MRAVFNIPNVFLRLDDLNSGGIAQSGVLGSNGIAQGIGVQLLYAQSSNNYLPVPLGQNIEYHNSAYLQDLGNGSFQYLLKARYYQLNESITSGSVDSLASFSVIYP